MNQKKKSSYDAKKEKLINIKCQLEAFYETHKPDNWIETNPNIIAAQNLVMRLMLDLIWEIVKDEKTK